MKTKFDESGAQLFKLYASLGVEIVPDEIPQFLDMAYPNGYGETPADIAKYRKQACEIMANIARKRIAEARRYELAIEIGMPI